LPSYQSNFFVHEQPGWHVISEAPSCLFMAIFKYRQFLYVGGARRN
jgi:hypothetical protein